MEALAIHKFLKQGPVELKAFLLVLIKWLSRKLSTPQGEAACRAKAGCLLSPEMHSAVWTAQRYLLTSFFTITPGWSQIHDSDLSFLKS